ncbi:SRPBCC family protein [Aspergillus foveolatus]|uniref:SRPBCC family protein n=1 Tax=Aspergillus foveolatus TaxID=210207 RepID=UPI003CCC8FB8
MAIAKIYDYTGTIRAPIGEVWALLSAFGSPRLWIPDCILTTVEGFGIGPTRTIAFGANPNIIIRETLHSVDVTKYSVRLHVDRDDLPGVDSYATFFLRQISRYETEMTWIGESSIPDEEGRANLRVWLDSTYRGFDSNLNKLLAH